MRSTLFKPVDASNRQVALAVRPKPEQQRFVSTVAESLADAERYGGGWPRLMLDGDEPVAFVMGGFGDASTKQFPRSAVWKLVVAADHQGKGYGAAAVREVAAEALRRGDTRLGVFFHPGEDGPEGFWLHLGFVRTDKYGGGREVYAEVDITTLLG